MFSRSAFWKAVVMGCLVSSFACAHENPRMGIFAASAIDLESLPATVGKSFGSCSCSHKTVITQQDVHHKTYVIKKSGTYCLASNVVFDPKKDGIPAIFVDADNVILDLNDHTLSQSGASFNKFDNVSGILIASGRNFVVVKDGEVTGFSDQGVLAQSINSDPQDHQGLIFENLNVNNCGKPNTDSMRVAASRSGIGVDGAKDVVILRCFVSEIQALTEVDAIGVFFSDNVLIDECLARDCFANNDDGFTTGISVNVFTHALIKKCEAIGIDSSFTNGIAGFAGNDLIVKDCSSYKNQGTSFALGISASDVNDLEILSCTANGNIIENTDRTGLAVGIDIFPANNVVIRDCVANANIVNKNAKGPVTIECGAFGFQVNNNSSNVLIEQCFAANNQVSDDAVIRAIGGFLLRRGSTSVVLRDCVAMDHVTDNPNTHAYGFAVAEVAPTFEATTCRAIDIDSCVAENNVNTANANDGFGIVFGATTIDSLVINCELKENNIGIAVQGSGTISNIFQNNEILGSATFGILAAGQKNAYINNYAYNPSATANYSGLPANTPIRTWTIGSPPAPSTLGDKLDNLDIKN